MKGYAPLRTSLLALALLLLLLLLVLPGCLGLLAGYAFFGPDKKVPEEVMEIFAPGVRTGRGRLEKAVYIQYGWDLGSCTDIAQGYLPPDPDPKLFIAGSTGVRTFDSDGVLMRDLKVSGSTETFQIMDVDNDGRFEFLRLGPLVGIVLALFESDGRLRWATPDGEFSFCQVGVGDLLGDEASEFVLVDRSRHVPERITVLDAKGQILMQRNWAYEERLYYDPKIYVVDEDGDGKNEIVVVGRTGKIDVLDRGLRVVDQREFPLDADEFMDSSSVPYPHSEGSLHLLVHRNDKVTVYRWDLTPVASFQEKRLVLQYPLKAMPVRLRSDIAPYFAILGEVWFQGGMRTGLAVLRSELFVFDAEGNLVYDEMLDDYGTALTVTDSAREGEEILLVGGYGQVYSFAWNHGHTADAGPSTTTDNGLER